MVSAKLRGTVGQLKRRDAEAVEMGEIDSSDKWRWEGNEAMRNDQGRWLVDLLMQWRHVVQFAKISSGCSLSTRWGMGDKLLISELKACTTLTGSIKINQNL